MDVENDVRQVRVCESSRVRNRRYIKVDKAIRTAFEKFDRVKDIKYLLRFAAKKSDDLGLQPLDINDSEYEEDGEDEEYQEDEVYEEDKDDEEDDD